MTADNGRRAAATAAFARRHAEDPTGDAGPYHDALAAWVEALDPDASEVVRLAALGQHIERWTIARADYPLGRTGYRKWRSALSQMHARRCSELLTEVGYDASVVRRVAALVTKQRLSSDPEAALLQDAVCLTFLERQLAGFAEGRDADHVASILAKTWAKMTPRGQSAARALAPRLSQDAQALMTRALASVDDDGA